MELYISCREALLVMGVIVLLCLILELNKEKTLIVFGEKAMLWHQIPGHIREKIFQLLHGKGMVEGMSSCSLDFDFCKQNGQCRGKNNV